MGAQQRGWRRNFSPSLFFLLSNIFSFGISLSLSLSRFRQSTAFLLFFPPPRHSIPIFRAIQTKTARAEFLPFVPSRVKVGAPHHPRLLSARPFFHHTQNCREREREREKRCFSSSIHPSIGLILLSAMGGVPAKNRFSSTSTSLSLSGCYLIMGPRLRLMFPFFSRVFHSSSSPRSALLHGSN